MKTSALPRLAFPLLLASLSIGVTVARMSDQVWAERAFVRTRAAKAPKIAVESAA